MALLLLDRAQLEVRCEGDALALYEAGQRRGTVPIRLIDRCIIQGAQTKLDSGVLAKLAEAGCTTVLMSARQSSRRVAIVLGPWHNDAAVRMAQSQCVLDDAAWCRPWAFHLVQAKIIRQRKTLQTLLAQRPDARHPLFTAIGLLTTSLTSLKDQASNPPDLASLRGREGAAARAYFAGLSGVMPPALGFVGRNRRPPRDPVNVCLSLGYTLLHADAVQACHIAGLDPLLGFYHRPSIGRESLASDLIEPLRPAVDLWVWEQLRSRSLREEHFSMDKGACILGKAGRQHFYTAWQASAKPWGRWLRVQARGLARTLKSQGQPWLVDGDMDSDETC